MFDQHWFFLAIFLRFYSTICAQLYKKEIEFAIFEKMCNGRDDDKFISILQDNRSLPDFLDSIFGFL